MRQTVRAFQERAEEADFTAVVDDIGPHSARELLACAADLADTMTPDGTPGGTVLVQADNSWRTVAATLAVGMTGGVLAVVNRHTTRAEFAAALEDIRPDVVIAEPAALAGWDGREGMPGARQAEVLDGWTVLAGRGPRDVSRWAGGALIGLTSGSTGRPKGVVQSESALRYACSSTADINGLRDGDAVAAIVPLSSTAAYCFGVCMALMLGGPLVLTGRWDREEVLRTDGGPRRPVDHVRADHGSADGLGGGRIARSRRGPLDHRRRRPHGPRQRSPAPNAPSVRGSCGCSACPSASDTPRRCPTTPRSSAWAATAGPSPAPSCVRSPRTERSWAPAGRAGPRSAARPSSSATPATARSSRRPSPRTGSSPPGTC